jgi:hypothetical protein
VHVIDVGAGDWWQVDVVLRPRAAAGDLNDRLIDLLRAALPDVGGVPPVVQDPQPTYSFDMSPPEGDLGVAVWVRAAGVGSAVEAGWRVVSACVQELLPGREPQLWDLRVVPASAVMAAPATSPAVARLRSRRMRLRRKRP